MSIFCQCCLNKCDDQVNMSSPVNNQGILEVYEEMLQYSTGIQLQPNENIHYICNICIRRLRESCVFKNQVQETQSRLSINVNSNNIKTEPDLNSTDYDNTSVADFDNDYIKTSTSSPKVSHLKNHNMTCKICSEFFKKSNEKEHFKQHNCIKCSFQFNSNEDYELHRKSCNSIFICLQCEKRFDSFKHLQIHSYTHKSKIQCKVCKKDYVKINEKEHEKQHTCTKCSRTITTNEEYESHKKHCKTTHDCPHCDKVYKFNHNLKRHLITHEEKVGCEICKKLYNKSKENKHKQHICRKCSSPLNNNKDYEFHKLSCRMAYACPHCDTTFEFEKHLKKHLKINHDEDKVLCEICDKIYSKIIEDVHKQSHVCKMCSLPYKNKEEFEFHRKSCNVNFVCPHCGKTFEVLDKYKRHLITHGGKTQCKICKKFIMEYRIQKHINITHNGVLIYPCKKCPLRFSDYRKRLKHMADEHGTELKKYPCTQCTLNFITACQRKRHFRRIHLVETNHACSECSKKFFCGKALEEHMVVHTGERNFECNVCHKRYARKRTLREHMKIHNNIKNYHCDICAKSFTQKCSLTGHLKNHHK